jgi:hypothetical protein
MALPKAIQAQVEQAEATLAAMNQPAPEAEAQGDVLVATNQPEQVVEPPPQAATQQAPTPQPDQWEHKYKTLQGRYNSDVPQLQNKVKDLETQLQTAIAKMNEVAKQEKPAEKKPVADPQDVEAFGADLVDMVQRVAERMFGGVAREFQEQVARFDQRLAQLEQGLQGTTQTVAMTAEQAFFDRLTKLVPNWEEVNTNEAFLAWLGDVDPVYGQPRQAALNAAQQSLNAERVANVFKAFMATMPQTPKSNPVAKQVSPKAAASTAPTGTDNKPIFTQAQVKAFYDEVAKGLWRGRQQEAQQVEARINAAMAEGRIR